MAIKLAIARVQSERKIKMKRYMKLAISLLYMNAILLSNDILPV